MSFVPFTKVVIPVHFGGFQSAIAFGSCLFSVFSFGFDSDSFAFLENTGCVSSDLVIVSVFHCSVQRLSILAYFAW